MSEFISRKRFLVFAILTGMLAVYIIAVYGSLAVKDVPQSVSRSNELVRGTIVDRNGKPLAVSTNFYHLSVTPSAVHQVELTAEVLAPVLQMEPNLIAQSIRDSSRVFYLKKHLDEAEYSILRELISHNKLTGRRFDKIPGRV